MGMQISDMFQRLRSNGQKTEGAVPIKNVQQPEGFLSEAVKGTIFEGTVLSVKDGQVVIGLVDGRILQARLEEGISLLEGTAMFFEVKSNEGSQVALRPFPQNNSNNPTLIQALQTAGIEVNEKNLSMVAAMMEERLPIDKQSLVQMARLVYENPEAAIKTLVQMSKFQLPVTENNIHQFDNYKTEQESILKEINQVMEQLPELFTKSETSPERLLLLNRELVQIFSQGEENQTVRQGQMPETVLVTKEQERSQAGQQPAPQTGNQPQVQHEVQTGALYQTSKAQTIINTILGQLTGGNKTLPDILSGGKLLPMELKAVIQDIELQLPEGKAEGGSLLHQLKEGLLSLAKEQPLGAGELEQLFREAFKGTKPEYALNGEEIFKEVLGKINGENTNQAQTQLQKLTEVTELLEKWNFSKEDMTKIFSGKEYRQLLAGVLEEQWLLKPEEAGEEGRLQKLYERLERQMSKLEQLQGSTLKETSMLVKSAADVRGNVAFMNDVNHYYNYVQIPLKLAGKKAAGELYVFTNKKALKDKKGEVTAHLHLDMEHLGVTEVSVAMKGKKVTTNFAMEKESSFDFIEEHIEELTEHLKEKGYDVTIKVENKEQKVNFVEDFLNLERPVGKVQRYTFDVRA